MSAELEPVSAAAAQTPFRVKLQDEDGDACHHFLKDGPVEVWIIAGPGRAAREDETVGVGDLKFMVEVLTFPNYEIARQHADALGLVARLLQNAIDEAREHAADPIPTLDDGHRHVVRFARYARKLPLVAMCEICMQELVPDVAKWAADRGLLGPGGEAFRIHERHGTIVAAIEHAFNHEPGLANG